ncbi:MAG: hypothetical protein MJ084_04460 [Saccharofermentans sp.]|nr:hypothetical protein [Saccharofermentans sp.]
MDWFSFGTSDRSLNGADSNNVTGFPGAAGSVKVLTPLTSDNSLQE